MTKWIHFLDASIRSVFYFHFHFQDPSKFQNLKIQNQKQVSSTFAAPHSAPHSQPHIPAPHSFFELKLGITGISYCLKHDSYLDFLVLFQMQQVKSSKKFASFQENSLSLQLHIRFYFHFRFPDFPGILCQKEAFPIV